jgi:carbamoyl-phosphate synthase large subunit
MNSNVLITSAGRRVELLEAFRNDAASMAGNITIHAADLKPELSAACRVADSASHLPHVTDPSYIGALENLCYLRNIGLVVPTTDTELMILAQHREYFANKGIHLVVSDAALISKCRDKRLTGDIFKQCGIDYPKIFKSESLSFPCFAKPYNGSSSIGARVVNNIDELTGDMRMDPSLIYMELIGSDYVEYTIDAYYDRNGKLRELVPRKRLETRAGEVSKSVTRKNFVYEILCNKLVEIAGARGCLTIQVFVNEVDHSILGLEVNPRFGGGYPLAYAAGAEYPGWLMMEYLQGKLPNFKCCWKSDLLMLRYDAKVLVNDFT